MRVEGPLVGVEGPLDRPDWELAGSQTPDLEDKVMVTFLCNITNRGLRDVKAWS